MSFIVSIIHVLITGPLLMYIGYIKPTNIVLYNILLGLGTLLLFIFGYKIINKIITRSINQYTVWYIIHFIIIVPLLIWCGIKQTKTPVVVFSLLLAIGCAAFGYHIFHLVNYKH